MPAQNREGGPWPSAAPWLGRPRRSTQEYQPADHLPHRERGIPDLAVLLATFPGGEDASRYRAGAHQRMDLLLKALRREEVVLFRRRQQHVLFYQVSKISNAVERAAICRLICESPLEAHALGITYV